MTNPVQQGASNFPTQNTPIVDPATGLLTQPWYLAQVDLYNRTGGSQGVSLASLQGIANNALNTASSAVSSASGAQNTADDAQTAAATAIADATSAQTTANSALTLATGALQANNNLHDLTNAAQARVNLGIDIMPISFTFLSSGQQVFVPIVQLLTVQINLAGTVTWAGTPPTTDTTFTLNCIRAGAPTTIGYITLIHDGNDNFVSSQPAFDLLVGDILQISGGGDVTLANVGITLALIRRSPPLL